MNLKHCDKEMKQIRKIFDGDKLFASVFECVVCKKRFKVFEIKE